MKLAHVIYKNKNGKEIYKLYVSTDVSLGLWKFQMITEPGSRLNLFIGMQNSIQVLMIDKPEVRINWISISIHHSPQSIWPK